MAPWGVRVLRIRCDSTTNQGSDLPKSVDLTAWAMRLRSASDARSRTRPRVRCGANGLRSLGQPAISSCSSTDCWRLCKALVSPEAPAHSTRGRSELGNIPRPDSCSENGPHEPAAACCAASKSSTLSTGMSPRNLRVRWTPSGLTHRTSRSVRPR